MKPAEKSKSQQYTALNKFVCLFALKSQWGKKKKNPVTPNTPLYTPDITPQTTAVIEAGHIGIPTFCMVAGNKHGSTLSDYSIKILRSNTATSTEVNMSPGGIEQRKVWFKSILKE